MSEPEGQVCSDTSDSLRGPLHGASDTIELRGLRVVAIVGALPEERTRAQPLEIDLDLLVDVAAAGASDALDDTVDYGAVAMLVDRVVVEAEAILLERLAALIVEAAFDHDGRIDGVRVTVRKLRPPVPLDLAHTAVTIERRRAE